MADTKDELAGVVDLFGGLARDELEQALVELAFKQGKKVEREAFAAEIERAVEDYYLVKAEYAADGGAEATDTLLVAGPAAFPTVPENGEDLPHILDVPDRELDREGLGEAVADRLYEEARTVAATGDADRAQALLDVSYDLEAWAPVETDEVRETLDRAFE
ncbi:hypothetical protein M0R88_11585 [Halorussus gelatinilyticus]|uniref:Uncharacterized protein n=1 Tax=Halorussus gelatinilyticus TaxID=2937524 RepID=A0A8U0IE40_9EURY|nr:hypothetical protein [Halorussus gelatinilyticus]UPV99167.1 hypothetical protein M0R88_11585 [Halorussus gelatinilyticus]